MLLKCIRDDDTVAGEPGAKRLHHGGPQRSLWPEPLLPEEKESQERRLREVGKHPFQGEREADDAAGEVAEVGPVGAELALHRDTCDDADGEVNAGDARPEVRRLVGDLIPFDEGNRFEEDDQQCQPYRVLGEEIVTGQTNQLNDSKA
jgi:hypothetical protein